eukprot:GHVT01053655.1.p1 GENE.GHVT01053655.1~~GHVT01053655.1.p1  ORF type:complete len:112 (+),score=13.20 GHVT01053655.1:203-538(+)
MRHKPHGGQQKKSQTFKAIIIAKGLEKELKKAGMRYTCQPRPLQKSTLRPARAAPVLNAHTAISFGRLLPRRPSDGRVMAAWTQYCLPASGYRREAAPGQGHEREEYCSQH